MYIVRPSLPWLKTENLRSSELTPRLQIHSAYSET
jgi:hypothetical protein